MPLESAHINGQPKVGEAVVVLTMKTTAANDASGCRTRLSVPETVSVGQLDLCSVTLHSTGDVPGMTVTYTNHAVCWQ